MTTLPSALRLGAVELTVRDLDRAIGWYQQALDLRLHGAAAARPSSATAPR